MADIAGNFLDAMGIVTDGALQKYKYDMTIKATVLKTNVEDKATKYSCKYEGTTFTATGTAGEYEVDDIVYVIVPQSDWDMEKYIVFKVEKDLGEDLDPFKNFLNVNDGHPDKYFPQKVRIIPNYNQHDPGEGTAYNYPGVDEHGDPAEVEQRLYDLSKQDEPFTRMGISIQFSTNHIIDWNCSEGNYGLLIKIYQQGSEDEATIYSLDTSDMLGNVYSAEGWYEYKKVFDISNIEINENTYIKFTLIEDGNFNGYDENMVLNHKLHTYPDPEDPDVTLVDEPPYDITLADNKWTIMSKNMNLYFGYAASDFYDGQIQLICNGDMRYDPSWEKDPNLKKDLKKKLKWYIQEKEKGYIIRKKIPVTSDRDNYVKVYYSKNSAGDFKQIAKVKAPNTSCTVMIKDTAEEKLEYKIKYWQKNLTYESDNSSPYISKESNTITFYRISAPEQEKPEGDWLAKNNPTGNGTLTLGNNNDLYVSKERVSDSVITGFNNYVGATILEVIQHSWQSDPTIQKGYVCIHTEKPNVDFYDLYYKDGGSFQLVKEYYSQTAPAVGTIIGAASKSIVTGDLNRLAANKAAIFGEQNDIIGGESSFAEGYFNKILSGTNHHIEGNSNTIEAIANSFIANSHAEGSNNIIRSSNAHAEGGSNFINLIDSHVEGYHNQSGLKWQEIEPAPRAVHAEGQQTIALGNCSHAEGGGNELGITDNGQVKENLAYGKYSHVEGHGTVAFGDCQHVFGKFNSMDGTITSAGQDQVTGELTSLNVHPNSNYIEIVGNGTGIAVNQRSNARTLDWSGNEWLAGNLTLGNSTTGGGNIILHYKDSNNTVHHIDVGATLVNLGYIQYTPPQP